jgi:hypothetical protein
VDDVTEGIDDLYGPVVPWRHVGRRLDDRRLLPKVGESRAIKRVVVRCHDKPLRRWQVVGETAGRVHRRAGENAEHQARSALQHLPHAVASELVDGGIAPIVDDAGERLDIGFVGEARRDAGRPCQIGMRGIEGARRVWQPRGILRQGSMCQHTYQGEGCECSFLHVCAPFTLHCSVAQQRSATAPRYA